MRWNIFVVLIKNQAEEEWGTVYAPKGIQGDNNSIFWHKTVGEFTAVPFHL